MIVDSELFCYCSGPKLQDQGFRKHCLQLYMPGHGNRGWDSPRGRSGDRLVNDFGVDVWWEAAEVEEDFDGGGGGGDTGSCYGFTPK